MNLNKLFENLDQYINWMENADSPESFSMIFSQFLMLLQFLFAFLEWGVI